LKGCVFSYIREERKRRNFFFGGKEREEGRLSEFERDKEKGMEERRKEFSFALNELEID
jgi:hypothetical protein